MILPGWGARIRTWEWRYQKPLPYRLATPQSQGGRRNSQIRDPDGNMGGWRPDSMSRTHRSRAAGPSDPLRFRRFPGAPGRHFRAGLRGRPGRLRAVRKAAIGPLRRSIAQPGRALLREQGSLVRIQLLRPDRSSRNPAPSLSFGHAGRTSDRVRFYSAPFAAKHGIARRRRSSTHEDLPPQLSWGHRRPDRLLHSAAPGPHHVASCRRANRSAPAAP